MTREEAKELLLHILMTYEPKDQYGDYDDPEPYEQALTMAIEVLSNCTTEKPNDIVEPKNDAVAEPTDLISRADATEELDKYFEHIKIIDKRGLKRIEPISRDVKGIINELPSTDRPSGEWKPVSEELPQSVGSYLVTCKGEHGSVYVDYDYWTVADEFKYNRDKVTAWIPFPKPYCGAKMGTEGRK